jgi:hypothetical protein
MSLEIEGNHKCDRNGCRSDAENCFCNGCFEEVQKEAYEDGYTQGLKESENKSN